MRRGASVVRSRIRETAMFARSAASGTALPLIPLLVLSFVVTLVLTLLASASAYAQTPVTGFVPPYEIVRTVRAAGFDPLAPPLREGTTYVLRATDFRGILMRVVVDARTGAIRDANRIVPGPGLYGPGGYPPGGYGLGGYAPPGYGPGGYGPRAYGPESEPRGYDPDTSRPPEIAPSSSGEASADAMPPSMETPSSRIDAPTAPPAEVDRLDEPPQQPYVHTPVGPPLPRPRPATLSAAKPSQDLPAATQGASNGRPGDSGLGDGKPARPDVAATAPMTPPKSPSTRPGKASNLPAIND
jgi:hypothetical protein